MKKKIVVKVQMNCEKCRVKAMKIAAGAAGVNSVAVEGDDKDKVVVVGDSVDAVYLVELLRKKVGHTTLLSVEEVKPKDDKPKETKQPSSTPGTFSEINQWQCVCATNCKPICPPYPQFIACETVCDQNPSLCTIM
ncbi:heavy metal-associated isoprenylated plant protein 47-like [Aristolochia californica]|uniref:heavy metal-associated isoprenylated plant protein 47-like n=1 Tax=Aristolochia californica TaxID=171875 RepID=UPI0035D9DE67